MKFNCECCNYSTDDKSNFNKHINSKKHKLVESKSVVSQKLVEISQKVVEVSQKLVENGPETTTLYKCKYCDQGYKHKSSLSKHIKYSCTKNKTEDLTELVRLLNLQLEQQKNEFESKLQSQTKQIEKLMEKLEINNTYNTNNTINVTNNINLLNYKDTDMSHITDIDYRKCFLKLIEKFCINPEKIENIKIILEK
jgi:hypothetical protein